MGEEAVASPSIGNTLWRVSTTFMRSAITRRKWTDLDEIWGTPSILSGAGPDGSWAWSVQKRERKSEQNFFCLVSNARFHGLLVSHISRSLHTIRGSMLRWIFLENLFENLPVRGLFFQKGQLLREHHQRLPTSGRDICEMNSNRGKSQQVVMPMYRMLAPCPCSPVVKPLGRHVL